MASASVKEFNNAWWSEVRHRIIGATVFVDEPVAECLHWEGGILNLMLSGAKSVKLLVPLEYYPKHLKKAVFITQARASDLMLVERIVRDANLTHCILMSAVSLEVLFAERSKDHNACELVSSGQAPFKAEEFLTKMIYTWMGKGCEGVEEVNAQVLHMPIFSISLTNVVFTTPPFTGLFPSNDNEYIKEPLSELRSLHKDDRTTLRRLACDLNSLLDSMNLKDDVYFMGNYSSMVAGVLENSPMYVNRRKNSLRPASLILVDRTLDLCGVASHSSESVYDKLRSVLHTYPGRSSECAINMSPICATNSTKHPYDIHMSPGTIFNADDEGTARTIDHMINKTQKEVMLEVYNRLSKINVNKSPSPENLAKVTPQSLEKIINAVKGNYDVISKNLGPIQQGLALIQMHKSKKRATMDLLMNFEKQMLQSLATSRESTSVLTQIAFLIRTRKQRNLPLENLLALLIQIYSLTGTEFPFVESHELELLEALQASFHEMADESSKETPEKAKRYATKVMTTLNDIKFMRKSFTKYSSLLKPCESGDGFEYKGLTQQLVEDLVDSSRPEIPDLQTRSDGFKHLLRTGLSMLNITGKKPKHPFDNQTVIIFMIGGTTAEECKHLHRTVITSGVDNTVLFGSTTFLSAEETTKMYMSPLLHTLKR